MDVLMNINWKIILDVKVKRVTRIVGFMFESSRIVVFLGLDSEHRYLNGTMDLLIGTIIYHIMAHNQQAILLTSAGYAWLHLHMLKGVNAFESARTAVRTAEVQVHWGGTLYHV